MSGNRQSGHNDMNMMKLINNLTIGSLLTQTAKRNPDGLAVTWLEESYTYKEMDYITDMVALSLLKLGVRKGTHIGLAAGDRPYTLFYFYAAMKIGAVIVFLNTALNRLEFIRHLCEADVEYLLYDNNNRGISSAEIAALDWQTRILSFNIGEESLRILLTKQTKELNSADKELLETVKSQVTESDFDTILFTSGTTDSPKGVVTTHFSRVNNCFAQARLIKLSSEDRVCSALPMFHCFALSGSILAALSAGACVCFPKDRHTASILDTIAKRRCTVFTAVPTLFMAILGREDLSSYDLSSLRVGLIGGSACSSDLLKRIEETLHYEILPSYGQTEATAGITGCLISTPLAVKSKTVGVFFSGIEGKIVDISSGEELPHGKTGEVCVRGFCVMQGYYKRPDLTEKAIDKEGWLHTGDLGYIDSDGNLHLTGRCKDIIIRGGENIMPGEIECVIYTIPGIRQVKVIGLPDPFYIEKTCACILTDEGVMLAAGQIKEYVRGELAYYKVPDEVVFLPSFPLLPNGKVDIAALKRMAGDIVSNSDQPLF